MKTRTHTYHVMQWLKSGRSITSIEAIDNFGCTRLAAIIFHLKHVHDLPIRTDIVPVTNRNGMVVEIARYTLAKEA